MKLEKCPYCGNISLGEVAPIEGTSYFLTEVDTSKNPPNFLPTSGLPVKVYGCSECKGILLKNLTFRL